MIGRTFQGAIQTLDFSNSMRTVLYKALGQALLSRIPDLYKQFNQTLEPLQQLVSAHAQAGDSAGQADAGTR